MRRTLLRSAGPGMALLPLGLLAIGLMKFDTGPLLVHKPSSTANTPAANKLQVVEAYGKLPLSFEANEGQTDNRVDFLSRGSGYTLFLTPTEAVLALRKPVASNRPRRDNGTPRNAEAEQAPAAPTAVLRMKLVGANPSPRVTGLEELPGKSNYFLGNDPDKWHTDVPNYARVQYQDVYPGVDLVYYGNQRQLEYDLVVAPGADPDAIALSFDGVEKLRIDAQGDLVLETAGGEIRQHKPLVYQEVDGIRREIAGSYVLNGGYQVGFQVAAYDAGKPLIIDPVLVYSTYLGGSARDRGRGIAVDAAGNAYVTGTTKSTDFPTANAFQAAFAGNISDDDTFVTKLNTAGNALVYSTYLGGSSFDNGEGIAVDAAGNAYVTGDTESTDFPTVSPFQPTFAFGVVDAFVTKLNTAGSALVYSTYLGGNGLDQGAGIAVDTSGNAYVTGLTRSGDFPTASPFQASSATSGDVFVTKLNASGSALVYSTYLGGSGVENRFGGGIAVDAAGNAYVTGVTESADFPTANPIQPAHGGGRDAFVTKLNAAGNALVYSTYLGGSGNDDGNAIAVDTSGSAYVTGNTDSTNFPTASPFQATKAGSSDAFIVKISDVAVGCTFSIAPTSESFPASGGTGSLALMAPDGCMWTASSNDSWITITSGESGSGNGTVEYSVAANPGASSRTGTMTIAGQTFTVTQAGTAPVSALTVSPLTLSFSGAVGDPPAQQALQVGSDAGTVNWSATVELLNGSGWLTVSPTSGSATLQQPATVTVEVNFAALAAAGVFQAVVSVTNTDTGFSIAVPVQAVVTSPGGQLLLDQTAFLFRVAEGGFAPPAQTLRVLNNGTEPVSWSLSELPPWLTASPQSGTAGVGAAQASAITLAANPSGLAAGVLQVLVTVSAPGASNDPQLFTTTLHVVPTNTPVTADIGPNGMLFVAEQDGALLAEQDLTVSNAGGGTLTADFVAATSSGGDWLMVSPTSGTASGGPFTTQVSVNQARLAAGVCRGTITGTFSAGVPQQVGVLLIVTPPGTALRTQAVGPPRTAQCAPSGLELLATTIGNGLSLPVSFPRVLVAVTVDTCGTVVSDATVLASIEGLNISLRSLGDGFYTGTWTPVSEAAEVTVTFVALHPSFATARRSFTVSTAAAPGAVQLPVLFPEGVVEGAGFTARRPLAPGGIISLFGARFATENNFATQLPLERDLAGDSVRIGDRDAPLYFAGPGQINAQVPFETRPGDDVGVTVNVGDLLTSPQNYRIAPVQPGIFIAGENAAILDASFLLVTAQNPVRAGDTIQIFCTGLGAVQEQVETGAPAPPFSTVQLPVTVTIGGLDAAIAYQGLAPGFVGLYQVNVVVPTGVATGAVPLVLPPDFRFKTPKLTLY